MDLKRFTTNRIVRGFAAAGALAILIGGTVLLTRATGNGAGYDYVPVSRTNLSAQVKLDGIITPATQVDLAFETSGAVASVLTKANGTVKAGQLLATLRAGDQAAAYREAQAGVLAAQAQVAVSQAALSAAQAQLTQTQNGATVEEKAAAQANVDEAKAKAAANLSSVTSSAVAASQAAVADARSALLTLTDIQYAYDHGADQDSFAVASAKDAAIEALFSVSGAGSWDRASVSGLNGGLYATVLSLKSDADPSAVETDLVNLEAATRAVASALASVPVTDAFTSADLAALDGATALVNGDVRSVAADLTGMKTEATNDAAAITAAQDQLAIVEAGSRPELIDAAQANVRRAEADLASAQARVAQAQAGVFAASAALGKTALRSPLTGTVTRVDAKVGQFAAASVPLISVMSSGAPEIDAWAAQTDVPDLSVGEAATFTLDAISGETFQATVVSVDAAPTDQSGVASYKVKLALAKEDPRVKSGMAANVSIGSATHENVLAVPQSALIRHGGANYVIVDDHGAIQREVETGLVSSDGQVEITRGLQEGDRVAQFGSAN